VESGRRIADTTGDGRVHTTIMLARLIRKAKEREKDKSARDHRPAEYPEATSQIWVVLPNDAWDLDDLGIMAVHFGPAFPRSDTLCIGDDEIRPQRNGPEYLGGRKGHQPEVPATVKTLGVNHYLPELTLALVERVNGRDWN
jgi:hypothetical protein